MRSLSSRVQMNVTKVKVKVILRQAEVAQGGSG